MLRDSELFMDNKSNSAHDSTHDSKSFDESSDIKNNDEMVETAPDSFDTMDVIHKVTNQIDRKTNIDFISKNTVDVLNHDHCTFSCEFLGIDKEWINDGSFHLWPATAFVNGENTTIDCEYVFASIKAVVIDHKDKNDDSMSFIYFYGRCVINPKASIQNWIAHDWNWKSTDYYNFPETADASTMTDPESESDLDTVTQDSKPRDRCCFSEPTQVVPIRDVSDDLSDDSEDTENQRGSNVKSNKDSRSRSCWSLFG